MVELLIVIAILGIIATIVIAAINPIEQANRGHDSGMKADASQIVSAIQRYYATHNAFPWNAASCTGGNCDNGASASPDNPFNSSSTFVSADDVAVGVCGVTGAGCKTPGSAQGELLQALELQTTFLNKAWIGAASAADKLYVAKADGASAGVFVCWSPRSRSNRQVLITSASGGNNVNKMYDVNSPMDDASGLPTAGTCTAVDDDGWKDGTCAECVPE